MSGSALWFVASTTFTSGSGKTIAATYDGANRMTQATVTPASGTAATYTYGYDGDNLRLTRTTGGTTTKFHYSLADGIPLLIGEGNLDYIYGPDGLPIEQIGADNTNPTYYTHDQHGDTRLLTNQTGTTTAVYTHTPYGTSTRKTGGTNTTTLLYGTGHTDTETGYTYLINRYLDPATGQFTTPDPLLSTTGTPYGYGVNNPLAVIDTLGLDASSQKTCGPISGRNCDELTMTGGASAVRYLSTTFPAGALLDDRERLLGQRFPTSVRLAVKTPVGGLGGGIAQLMNDSMRSDLTGSQQASRAGTAVLVGAGAAALGEVAAGFLLGAGAASIVATGAGILLAAVVGYAAYQSLDYLTDRFPAVEALLGDWTC